jgi:predicted  nucleic acid-binding Zn-ribbon protein
MNDRSANNSGHVEPSFPDVEAATRRLTSALDALESAVERRREADRDENELASRIQALGADRSRLADELDGSLVKSRRLERANREIAERLDAAIGTIREVLDAEDVNLGLEESLNSEEAEDEDAEDEEDS